jgi:glycine/D-amino acid oxidase-like deaminating enzyme
MEKLTNSNLKICIIGAGVNGLSVAYRLIELNNSINPLNITIIAKDFGRNTTSDGAAGLYRPDQRFMPGVSKELATYF